MVQVGTPIVLESRDDVGTRGLDAEILKGHEGKETKHRTEVTRIKPGPRPSKKKGGIGVKIFRQNKPLLGAKRVWGEGEYSGTKK